MKTFLKITAFLFSLAVYAQDETIKLTDLELPNAPAFTILDYSPTIISNPKTTQELTLSLINSVNSSNGMPTDYALEFTPFWTFSGENTSLKSYLESEVKPIRFEPYKNLSISLASVKKDSIQNLSFGLRTNVLTISNEKINEIVKGKNNSINQDLVAINYIIDNEFDFNKNKYESGSNEAKEWDKIRLNLIAKNTTYKDLTKKIYDKLEEIKRLRTKPKFSIDIASAYNHFFDDKEYKSGKFGRFGAWATVNYNAPFKNEKNYLCLYGYARYLVSEMEYDTITVSYVKDKSLDFGGKLEFQFSDLTIGYEYVKRTSEKENYRSVGNIKYKINDNIILNGGFGKNFEKTDNLISFFGVSWGISQNNNLKLKNPQSNSSP